MLIMNNKKKYAHVGLGARSTIFSEAIVQRFPEHCEYSALCDNNEGRLKLKRSWAAENGVKVPIYNSDKFDLMIAETKPDVVIVTTRDCRHDDYICRALELGCDVITEKPMTTDEKKCQRIIDTAEKTGKKVTVAFNYRYAPPRTQVKDLLMSGVIGNILSVDFQWLLNIKHGASYFRRWHRNKKNSGGLLVHKATHHFDLVSWWLSACPETVFARGKREFYTPETADRYGLAQRGERCLDCPEKSRCRFYLDIKGNTHLKKLYLDNEKYDGYYRDRCVFSPDIDIEDSMNLIVNYDSGAIMTYSLNTFMPWEGYNIAFNGTKGRLEHICQEKVYESADGTIPGTLDKEGTLIKIFPHFAPPYQVEVWTGEGGHGGGDNPLLGDLFLPEPPEDKYLRAADHRSGSYSILTGIAGNKSMEQNLPVKIEDLVYGLKRPELTSMPAAGEPLD